MSFWDDIGITSVLEATGLNNVKLNDPGSYGRFVTLPVTAPANLILGPNNAVSSLFNAPGDVVSGALKTGQGQALAGAGLSALTGLPPSITGAGVSGLLGGSNSSSDTVTSTGTNTGQAATSFSGGLPSSGSSSNSTLFIAGIGAAALILVVLIARK